LTQKRASAHTQQRNSSAAAAQQQAQAQRAHSGMVWNTMRCLPLVALMMGVMNSTKKFGI
jgi:hypothetical protein